MSNSEPNAMPEVPINKQLADALLSEWSGCSYANTHGMSEKCSEEECTFTSELHESATNATPDQLPIDDQIIAMVRVARALGYDDVAELIEKCALVPLAEVSEPRKCRQTVNVFGYSLAGGCRGEVFHGKLTAHCGHSSNMAGCAHHDALFAPPASEPFRTDAVREAIAQVKLHDPCPPSPYGCAVADELASDSSRFNHIITDCSRFKTMRPLVAALADAERKLADQAIDLLDAQRKGDQEWQRTHYYKRLRHYATEASAMRDKLADAEKRAKDAEAESTNLRHRVLRAEEETTLRDMELTVIGHDITTITGWLEKERSQDAALTRKLTAALEVLKSVEWTGDGDYYPCPSCGGIKPDSPLADTFQPASIGHRSNCALRAAIDAPAGEEAERRVCANGCGRTATFGRVCCLNCTATGHHNPNCAPPEPANAPSFVPSGHPDFFKLRDGKTSEPTNAQGSESGHACDPARACVWCGRQALSPTPAPRFTSEEARQRAIQNDEDADLCRHVATHPLAGDSLETDAEEHARIAESWRHYADLLERDDALERAAESVVDAWTARRDVPNRLFGELRNVLAQRAKGKQ